MTWLKVARSRLRGWLRRSELEARMDEEIRHHLELETAKNLRAGLEPAEARRRALVAFGGVERHREGMRAGRRLPLVEDLWRDLRYALRSLRRVPGFALAALVTLALGIAAPTVMFTVVNAVLLRPLPVPGPDRLVRVQQVRQSGGTDWVFSLPELQAYEARSGAVFTGMAAEHVSDVTLSSEAGPEVALAMDVTGRYWDVLGIAPALGTFPRGPNLDRSDARGVVVIGYDFWRSRYGGDPAVVGRTLLVNNHPLTIAGVAPRGFHGAMLGARPAIWLPVGLVERLQGRDPDDPGWGWLHVFGRLRPGIDRERARAALAVVAHQVSELMTTVETGAPPAVDVRVSRFASVPARMERQVTGFLLLLLCAGSLVLLIATTNVAGMFMARGAGRRREMAIRVAIGAGRGRVVRQLLTESTLLALMAAVLGVLIALGAGRWLGEVRPPFAAAFHMEFPVDTRVLAFAAAVSVASGILFGLTPALHALRRDLVTGLRDATPGGGRRPRLRSALVAGQLALTLVLLIAAGLFGRTVRNALQVDYGFDPEGVLALELNLALNGYDEARAGAFNERLLERVRALPGIEAASMATLIPMSTSWDQTRVRVPGHEPPEGQAGFPVGFNLVTAGYFETMRMPVLTGRPLRPGDAGAVPTPIVVNRTFARRFWPENEAIGHVIRLGTNDAVIVGIVPESKYATLGEEARLFAYVASGGGAYAHRGYLHARTGTDPAAALQAIRAAIAELDPNVPIVHATTVEEVMAGGMFAQSLAARLIGGFGLVGLSLAAIGLFGLLSFSVAERTREIGVRMALGAGRNEVLRMILREGMRPLAAGVAIGLVLAALVAHLLRGLLYDLSPLDPVTFLGVPLVLLAVALVAAWLPAGRATRVEAVRALRAE